ncbi:hypothetical protein, partial [Pedobacter sp.]|uniref:hypothetical protein n=1 Tax=Pedobacter sp. TaxID=1411316 RepID=UPI003D7FFBD0
QHHKNIFKVFKNLLIFTVGEYMLSSFFKEYRQIVHQLIFKETLRFLTLIPEYPGKQRSKIDPVLRTPTSIGFDIPG